MVLTKAPKPVSKLEETLALHIRAAKLLEPVREYKFDGTRKFRFDVAWPAAMVGVEVEGGVFSGGRHTRGTGFEADAEKYNLAAMQGWRVFRLTSSTVNDGTALQTIERALEVFA